MHLTLQSGPEKTICYITLNYVMSSLLCWVRALLIGKMQSKYITNVLFIYLFIYFFFFY